MVVQCFKTFYRVLAENIWHSF